MLKSAALIAFALGLFDNSAIANIRAIKISTNSVRVVFSEIFENGREVRAFAIKIMQEISLSDTKNNISDTKLKGVSENIAAKRQNASVIGRSGAIKRFVIGEYGEK